MTNAEQTYIDGISHDDFFTECVDLWRSAGSPILSEMHSLILEEYNNEAIAAFMDKREEED